MSMSVVEDELADEVEELEGERRFLLRLLLAAGEWVSVHASSSMCVKPWF